MAKLNVPLPTKPVQVPETPAPSPAAKQHLAEAATKTKRKRAKRRNDDDPICIRSVSWPKSFDKQVQDRAAEASYGTPNITQFLIAVLTGKLPPLKP